MDPSSRLLPPFGSAQERSVKLLCWLHTHGSRRAVNHGANPRCRRSRSAARLGNPSQLHHSEATAANASPGGSTCARPPLLPTRAAARNQDAGGGPRERGTTEEEIKKKKGKKKRRKKNRKKGTRTEQGRKLHCLPRALAIGPISTNGRALGKFAVQVLHLVLGSEAPASTASGSFQNVRVKGH